MFWVDRKAEPNNKFKFYARFSVFESSKDNPNNGFLPVGSGEFNRQSIARGNLTFSVKKIDAPKLNLDFERAYANEYVHYFQNGSIHWEPINITFADMAPLKDDDQTPNLKEFFFTYLKNLAYHGLENKYNEVTPIRDFNQNRTNIVDLPNLCETIQIVNVNRFANSNYIKGKDLFGLNQDDTIVNNRTGSIEQKAVSTSAYKQNIFVIHKPKLTKVDFGSFDYGSDEINEISITVVPEWCSYSAEITG